MHRFHYYSNTKAKLLTTQLITKIFFCLLVTLYRQIYTNKILHTGFPGTLKMYVEFLCIEMYNYKRCAVLENCCRNPCLNRS